MLNIWQIRDSTSKCNFAVDLSKLSAEDFVDEKQIHEMSLGNVTKIYEIDSSNYPVFVCDDDYAIDRADKTDDDGPFKSPCSHTSKTIIMQAKLINSKGEEKRIYNPSNESLLGTITTKECGWEFL